MTPIAVDGLVVDLDRWTITLDGSPVVLSKLQFEMLAHLAGAPDRVFRYHELLRDVWGFPSTIGIGHARVAVCASTLHKALGGRFVFVVRAVGYRLVAP